MSEKLSIRTNDGILPETATSITAAGRLRMHFRADIDDQLPRMLQSLTNRGFANPEVEISFTVVGKLDRDLSDIVVTMDARAELGAYEHAVISCSSLRSHLRYRMPESNYKCTIESFDATLEALRAALSEARAAKKEKEQADLIDKLIAFLDEEKLFIRNSKGQFEKVQ